MSVILLILRLLRINDFVHKSWTCLKNLRKISKSKEKLFCCRLMFPLHYLQSLSVYFGKLDFPSFCWEQHELCELYQIIWITLLHVFVLGFSFNFQQELINHLFNDTIYQEKKNVDIEHWTTKMLFFTCFENFLKKKRWKFVSFY